MMSVALPRRATSFVALSAALLVGCFSIGGEKAELTVYAPLPVVAKQDSWPTVDWSLAIAEPSSSTALDSPQIAVRPKPGQLQVYAGAVWSDSAPALLQSTLVRAFSAADVFDGVALQQAGIGSDRLLQLDIVQFEAVYTERGEPPQVVLAVNATLVDSRRLRPLASRSFRVVREAPGEKLREVMPVFEQALADLAGEMIGWSLAAPSSAPPAP